MKEDRQGGILCTFTMVQQGFPQQSPVPWCKRRLWGAFRPSKDSPGMTFKTVLHFSDKDFSKCMYNK